MTIADGILAGASLINTGILTGIFYRMGGMGEAIEGLKRRVGKLEERTC